MRTPSFGLAQIVAQMTADSSIGTDKKRPKLRVFVYTHTTGYGLGGFDAPTVQNRLPKQAECCMICVRHKEHAMSAMK